MGQWIRFRLGFLFMCFVAFFGLVSFRLLQLQVWPNPQLEELGQKQFTRLGKKSRYRMPLFDRNHEELAVSMPSSSVFARPKIIRARRKIAHHLSQLMGGTPSKWMQRLDPQKPFVWIQRQVGEDVADKLSEMNLPGIFIEPENRRLYPNGNLAASVLGFTDIDGNGISGLELSLNNELLEAGNRTRVPRDGKGNPSYIAKDESDPEEKKQAVNLTIDRRIQNLLEEELLRAQEESGAKAVMAIVMDPKNGEIFAMGQAPGFDPNNAKDFSQAHFTNRWVSHLYEPGSTMKTLFAAEAIQSGLLTKASLIDCEQGKLRVGDRTISEAMAHEKFGRISLEKVIQVSSNVGAVKVAQLLGFDRAKATLDKFGLTAKTNIALPGEVTAGSKSDEHWKPIFLANVGFGQGVGVTPLQMVASYAPFANGGYLVRPRILMRESPSVTGESAEVRRVLSPETVKTMREILVSVTEGKEGTGVKAAIPGIRVAGKTGTAQKYESGSGYDSKKYFSSFIGFLPADNPQLLVGVMIDEPKNSYYASEVAVPVFKRIAERSLTILDRFPKNIASANRQEAPTPAAQGKEVVVEKARPALQFSADGKTMMPDLKGVSLRDSMRILARYSGSISIAGAGFLVSQTPTPGTLIEDTSPIQLTFSHSATQAAATTPAAVIPPKRVRISSRERYPSREGSGPLGPMN